MYGLVLNTAPTIEPVTLAEAKHQCGVAEELDHHDARLNSLIVAATRFVERAMGRQLINATWDLVLDRFPGGAEPILIPKSPLVSVTSITYLDTDGASQTWSSANYRVLTTKEPGHVALAYQIAYPALRGIESQVTVRFVAGYGATRLTVPEPIKQCILLLVGHWFKNREATITGTIQTTTELAVDSLIANYVVGEEFTCYEGVI